MLTENQVKEQLSIAYVNAVSAICNFGCELTRVDFDSIDATITCNGNLTEDSTIRSPEIKLQLKATEELTMNRDNAYPFNLSKKNYDDLRANTLTPRLLVVLNLPLLRENWMSHSVNDLVIRNCAFWLNLKGAADSSNISGITVHLPSTNVFSPESLRELMIKVARELPL